MLRLITGAGLSLLGRRDNVGAELVNLVLEACLGERDVLVIEVLRHLDVDVEVHHEHLALQVEVVDVDFLKAFDQVVLLLLQQHLQALVLELRHLLAQKVEVLFILVDLAESLVEKASLSLFSEGLRLFLRLDLGLGEGVELSFERLFGVFAWPRQFALSALELFLEQRFSF